MGTVPRVTRTAFLHMLLAGVCVLMHLTTPMATQALGGPHRVLILHSYHQGFSWTNDIQAAFSATLARSGLPLEVYVKYLDVARITDPKALRKNKELLQQQIVNMSAGKPFDMVLVSDNAALDFLLEHRESIAGNAPVVFCGINNFSQDMLRGQSNITGVAEIPSFYETIVLANKLRPMAGKLLVLAEDTPTGKANLSLLQAQSSRLSGRVEIEVLEETDIYKLEARLAGLSPEWVVLPMVRPLDENGVLSAPVASQRLSRACTVPLFVAWDFWMGHGPAAGVVVSGTSQGETAAAMVSRILMGERADDIPVVSQENNVTIADNLAFTRFGMSESLLPEGAVILNAPVSFYAVNKVLLLTGGAVGLCLLLLSIFLALNVTRRKRAEALYLGQLNFVETLMRAMPAPLFYKDAKGRYLGVNPAFETLMGKPAQDFVGRLPTESFSQEHGQFFVNRDQELSNPGESQRYQYVMPTALGVRTLMITKTVFPGEDGSPAGIVGILDDITDRTRNEESLRESEERFKALHNASFGGIAIHDKGIILDCNKGLSDISGYTKDELVGMDGLLLIAEQSKSAVMGNILSGYEKPYEAFGVRKNGEEYPVQLEARNIPYHARMVRAVEFRDITANKLAEARLLRSELLLRTLRDSIPDLVWLKNTDGVYLSCNTAFERFLGCKEERIIGKSDYDFFEPALADCFKDNDRKAIEADGPRMNEEWLTFAQDGYHGLFETLKTPMRDETDSVIGVLGIARDITSRKKAEDSLRQSELRFKRMLNAIPDMVSIHDPSMNILYSNWQGFAAVPEYKRVVNTKCYKTYRDHDSICPDCRATQALLAKEPFHEEVKVDDALWLDVRIIPLLDANDHVEMFIEWVRDITLVKKNEDKLLLTTQLAETANHAKSEFLANMSHEIRTPLNGILGMLQLLRTTDPNEEQKEYLMGAIRSTNRLTRLLSDILDISRIEAGRMEIVEAEFDIKKMRESIYELFDMEARGKGLLLEFGWNENLPLVLIGDEIRLRQILFNLVGNAIKFTETGEVRIDACLLASLGDSVVRVLITVSDTGIGISEESVKSVFEPFVQAEGTYTRRFQGAGLGLSIVRRLVNLLGGDISIDSTLGEGTTVYLSLPLKIPVAKQNLLELKANPVITPSLSSLRILIAEDDTVSSLTCKRMLEKTGYSVTSVKDGKEALQLLYEKDFDLILMDIQMPVMDGVEATKAIRRTSNLGAKSGIPIVAMTAYAMAGDREKFLAAGMNDYISKPVDLEDLKEVINRILNP